MTDQQQLILDCYHINLRNAKSDRRRAHILKQIAAFRMALTKREQRKWAPPERGNAFTRFEESLNGITQS